MEKSDYERLVSLIQTMPVNYYLAALDSIKHGEYQTVKNIIELIHVKFRRNPDLYVSMDLNALDVADNLLTNIMKQT